MPLVLGPRFSRLSFPPPHSGRPPDSSNSSRPCPASTLYPDDRMSNLSLVDILVIAAYFIVLAAIAWWAAKREKNVSADFFLASRDVGWLAVGASLFASNIGSEHLVGLAGTGAASGLAVGHFEWLPRLLLPLLRRAFRPFYLRPGGLTPPGLPGRR